MSDDPVAESITTPRPAWWRLVDGFAVLAVLPSLIAGTARWWWVGDLCCHFRLLYAATLTLLLLAYGGMNRWRWTLAIAAVWAVNVSLLWPLFAVGDVADASGRPLRMMVANVYIGSTDPQPILRAVSDENPDLLVLVEVDERWIEDLEPLRDAYPHVLTAIRDEGYGSLGPFGIAIFSRLPLANASTPRLGTANIPAVVASIEHDGRRWTVIGAHPYPPVNAACSAVRNSLLQDLGQLARDMDGPTVVLGDLNTTRWSPHFSLLLEAGKLRDSSTGFGYQPTWPDWLSTPIIPIDHVLISPEITVLKRHVGPSIASDHRPVIVDLAIADQSASTD